jgi:hypothetical protein
MCLHPRAVPPVPADTARVAYAAFRKGNLFMRMRDEFGAIYSDDAFAALFRRKVSRPRHRGGMHWSPSCSMSRRSPMSKPRMPFVVIHSLQSGWEVRLGSGTHRS